MKSVVSRRATVPNNLFFAHLLSYLEQGQEVRFRLKGSSMQPYLQEGDEVVLQSMEGVVPKKGHIVLAETRAGYVLHRIVRIMEQQLWLAGDANLVQVERVGKEEVKAFATGVYREGKHLDIYSKNNLVTSRLWYYLRPLRRVFSKLLK